MFSVPWKSGPAKTGPAGPVPTPLIYCIVINKCAIIVIGNIWNHLYRTSLLTTSLNLIIKTHNRCWVCACYIKSCLSMKALVVRDIWWYIPDHRFIWEYTLVNPFDLRCESGVYIYLLLFSMIVLTVRINREYGFPCLKNVTFYSNTGQ